MVGDIAPWDASHRMYRQVQLLAAFQYLEDKPGEEGVNAYRGGRTICLRTLG